MKVLLQWGLALLCLFGMRDVKSQDLNLINPSVSNPKIVLPIGHLDYMENAVFSPDEKFIVTSNSDGTAKVYDVATGKELRTLNGQCDYLIDAFYSPDGKYIITIGEDSAAILFDAYSGNIKLKFDDVYNDIDEAKFILNGKYIVFTTQDNTYVYETFTGKRIHKSQQAIFSEDGSYVEINSSKNKYTVSNLFSRKKKFVLNGCIDLKNPSSFSKDGKLFFANINDSLFTVYDVLNERKLYSFSTDNSRISFASFSPANKHLLVGSRDSVISIYNQKGMLEYKSKAKGVLEKAFFRPDEKLITLFYENYGSFRDTAVLPPIQLLDIQQKQVVSEIPHEKYMVSIDMNISGTKLITTSFDENIIWDVISGKKLTSLKPYSLYINNVNISPNNNNLVIACPYTKIWDIRKGKPILELKDEKSRIFNAVYNKKGDKIFTYCSDSASRIWNASDGNLLKKLNTINRISVFSESNNKLVNYGMFPEIFHVYDFEKGSFILDLNSNACNSIEVSSFVYVCRLSNDGSRFVISNRKNINIWDVNNGTLVYNLTGHKGNIKAASISSDDNKMVTASSDNTAKVWDLKNGNLLYTFYGHKDEVNEAVFSHDLKTIATASEDGTVKLWEANTGKLIKTLSGHHEGVREIVFNEDDTRLIASQYSSAILWDLKSFKPIADLTDHYGIVRCNFSSDNKYIISYGSTDHTIHFWDNMGKKLYSMLFIGENDYLVFDAFNHYDGSKGALAEVYYVQGDKIISPSELSNKDYVPGLVERIMSNY
jgi:WD40 repeat protein